MQTQKQEKKGNSRKGLIIAFVILLLGINGVQLFFNLTQNNKIEEQKVTIDNQKAKIDSAKVELDKTIKELEVAKADIAKLGGDTAELHMQLEKIKAERDRLVRDKNYYYSQYLALKAEIDNARMLRDKAEKEAADLRLQLAQKDTVINAKNQEIVMKEQQINTLKEKEKELSDKVAVASVLRASDFAFEAVNAKGKIKQGLIFKAKYIDVLKITFNLAENKVAEKGPRDIYIRVIEPDGNVLFDTQAGGGTFTHDGKDHPFTMKSNVTYMNSNQKVVFDYKKGSPYKVGKHKIEVYCEEHRIGEAYLDVQK